MRIVKLNEALGTARYVNDEGLSVDEFAARLTRSSVLENTRSFVVWYVDEPLPPRDEFGRPQYGTVRREIARGLAR